MKLDAETVRYVAKLARMKLSDSEVKSLSVQLDSILKYVEKLNKVDTTDVQPTSHVLPLANVYRQDKVKPSLSAPEALSNAPDKDGDFFRVPKIIE